MLVLSSLGVAVAGAVLAAVGSGFDHSPPGLPAKSESSSTIYYGVGGGLIGVGVVMAISGGALWASNRTGVDEIAALPAGLHF